MSLVQVRQEIDEKLDTLDAEMLKAIHTILYAQSEEVQNGRSSFSRKSSGLTEGEVDYDVNGVPSDRDSVIQEMEAISDRVESGEEQETPLDEVQNRIEKWLKITK